MSLKRQFIASIKHQSSLRITAKCIGREMRCHVVDVTVFTMHNEAVLQMKGIRLMTNEQIPPALTKLSRNDLRVCAKNVGIMAFEYYCPNHCMRAADLEDFHNYKGRYTTGHGHIAVMMKMMCQWP